MHANRLLLLGALLASVPLAACDDPRAGPGADPAGDAAPRAEYGRELIFVAADASAGAVLDFTTIDVGSRIHRTARGWAEGGSGWVPLYDLTWDGPALRRAWRLVPFGPLHLRVGLDDEIEAIVVRDADAAIASLETGDFVSEWAPFRSTQLVLRRAALSLGDAPPVAGWLVDARFGVTPGPDGDVQTGATPGPDAAPVTTASAAAELPQTARDADTTDDGGDRTRAEAGADSAADGNGPPPPVRGMRPVQGLRAVLVTADGAAIVLGDTDAGVVAWTWTTGRELTVPGVILSPLADEPAGWRIQAGAGGTLSGRLEGLDEDPMPLAPRMVRGTVDVDGRELEVHGVLRPPDAAAE